MKSESSFVSASKLVTAIIALDGSLVEKKIRRILNRIIQGYLGLGKSAETHRAGQKDKQKASLHLYHKNSFTALTEPLPNCIKIKISSIRL
jgi:hypothetical protein